MKTSIALLCVSILVGAWLAEAAVYHSDAVEETVNGRKQWYCEYKGLKLLPRSRFRDMDTCQRCVCTRASLSCSDLLMSYSFPEDSKCVPITVRCNTIWVLKKNPKRRCPESLMPPMSAVGK